MQGGGKTAAAGTSAAGHRAGPRLGAAGAQLARRGSPRSGPAGRIARRASSSRARWRRRCSRWAATRNPRPPLPRCVRMRPPPNVRAYPLRLRRRHARVHRRPAIRAARARRSALAAAPAPRECITGRGRTPPPSTCGQARHRLCVGRWPWPLRRLL
eukprot:scaffold65_cov353-Prasinococcus_capsulatus_cf.AAC.2